MAVIGGEGKAVRAVEVGVRRIEVGAVAVESQRAVRGPGALRKRQRIAVGVGTGHTAIEGCVFVRRRARRRRRRCMVGRREHQEGFAGRHGAAIAVADRVAQHHRRQVVGFRRDREGAVAIVVHRAVRCGQAGDGQGIAVGVGKALQQ